MSTFGELIAKQRKALGLSTRELGSRLGLTHSAIFNWETGKTKVPSREVIPKLAEALQIDETRLLEAAGYPQAPETEKVRTLTELVTRLTELHLQQAELLRAAGYLPANEPKPDNSVPPRIPSHDEYLQELADRYYNGDRHKALIHATQALLHGLEKEELERRAQASGQHNEHGP